MWKYETGAIDTTGHKIITKVGTEGKLTPVDVQEAVDFTQTSIWSNHDSCTFPMPPRLTIITSPNLPHQAPSADHKLLLFMDGARLGHTTSSQNDPTLGDIRA